MQHLAHAVGRGVGCARPRFVRRERTPHPPDVTAEDARFRFRSGGAASIRQLPATVSAPGSCAVPPRTIPRRRNAVSLSGSQQALAAFAPQAATRRRAGRLADRPSPPGPSDRSRSRTPRPARRPRAVRRYRAAGGARPPRCPGAPAETLRSRLTSAPIPPSDSSGGSFAGLPDRRLGRPERPLGLRQHQVVDAQPHEQAARRSGRSRRWRRKPRAVTGSSRDQLEPVAFAQARGRHRRRRGSAARLRASWASKPRIAQPQARLAQDPRLLGSGQEIHRSPRAVRRRPTPAARSRPAGGCRAGRAIAGIACAPPRSPAAPERKTVARRSSNCIGSPATIRAQRAHACAAWL